MKNITILVLLVFLLAGGGWHYYTNSSLEQRYFKLSGENYQLKKGWKREWNEDIGRKYYRDLLAGYRMNSPNFTPDLTSESWMRLVIAHVNQTFSPSKEEYLAHYRSVRWMDDWNDDQMEKARKDFELERPVVKMRQQYYLAALYDLWQGNKYSEVDPERNVLEIISFFPKMPREKWGELWFRQIMSPGFSDMVDPTFQIPSIAAGTTADLKTLAQKAYGEQFLSGINNPEVCRQKARDYFLKYVIADPPEKREGDYNYFSQLLVREAEEMFENSLFLARREYTKEEWEGYTYNQALVHYLDNIRETHGERAYLLELGKSFPYGDFILRTRSTLEQIAKTQVLSSPEKEQIFRAVNARIEDLARANPKVREAHDLKKPYEVAQFN